MWGIHVDDSEDSYDSCDSCDSGFRLATDGIPQFVLYLPFNCFLFASIASIPSLLSPSVSFSPRPPRPRPPRPPTCLLVLHWLHF